MLIMLDATFDSFDAIAWLCALKTVQSEKLVPMCKECFGQLIAL